MAASARGCVITLREQQADPPRMLMSAPRKHSASRVIAALRVTRIGSRMSDKSISDLLIRRITRSKRRTRSWSNVQEALLGGPHEEARTPIDSLAARLVGLGCCAREKAGALPCDGTGRAISHR